MPKKKFELRTATPGATDRPAVASPINQTLSPAGTLDDEDEGLIARARGSRPKFSRVIPVDRIYPNPWQARQVFDPVKLQELADGMREHGWVGGGLPVRQHPAEAGMYQLVFGERRWRAAKLAGLTAIPCEVSTFSDDDLIEIGLLENIQREDLTRYEEGVALKSLLELRDDENRPRYSIRSLAKRLGKDKSYVEDRLQYAHAPEEVQQLAKEKPDIAPRMVRELAHVEDESVRGVLIEAVKQDQVDIEDVRQIRKQLAQTKSEFEQEVEAKGAADDVGKVGAGAAPVPGAEEREEAKPWAPTNPDAQRWLLSGRLSKDDAKITKLLKGWTEKPDFANESLSLDVRMCIRGWENLIAQLKEVWKREEETPGQQ